MESDEFITDDLKYKATFRYSFGVVNWRGLLASEEAPPPKFDPAWRARYEAELERRKNRFGMAFYDACMKQMRGR